jgi:hypothetical protein
LGDPSEPFLHHVVFDYFKKMFCFVDKIVLVENCQSPGVHGLLPGARQATFN